jgi:hypothetical protein
VRDRARRAAFRVAPGYMADRAVRYERDLRERLGALSLVRKFTAQYGCEVRDGPFAGLNYPEDGDAAIAKYLGCYEAEIRDWMEDAVRSRAPYVIVIGAADGYYAVGLKHASPESKVIAFELSPEARAACSHTAASNGCGIDLRRGATACQVLRLPAEDAFVLCDCEGAEIDILTPQVVRHLHRATVVVELHDGIRADAAGIITRRFAATHDFEMREICKPDKRPAKLADWSDTECALALAEHRAIDLRWARFTPKSSRRPVTPSVTP